MGRLTADFAKAFSRDLKKNAKRRNWNLTEHDNVIDTRKISHLEMMLRQAARPRMQKP